MKAILHLVETDERINWYLHLGYGLSVDQYKSYKVIQTAVAAAKKTAIKLGIDITDCEYTINETGERMKLNIK